MVEDKNNNFKETSLFAQSLIKKFEKLTLISKKEMNESLSVLKNNEDSSLISNTIAGNLNISILDKQKLLETNDVKLRLERINELIEKETSVISVDKDKR